MFNSSPLTAKLIHNTSPSKTGSLKLSEVYLSFYNFRSGAGIHPFMTCLSVLYPMVSRVGCQQVRCSSMQALQGKG